LHSNAKASQSGTIRLEIVVVVVVLLVLAGFLLRSLQVVQQGAERTLVDTEVMNLRTELQLSVAAAVNRGDEKNLASWAGKNPLVLAGKAADADVRTKSAGGLSLGGDWRWNAERKALTYDYLDGGHVALKVVRVGPMSGEGWGLGGGLMLLREKY
jgi:type II secretory pathway pseudopilin PulG